MSGGSEQQKRSGICCVTAKSLAEKRDEPVANWSDICQGRLCVCVVLLLWKPVWPLDLTAENSIDTKWLQAGVYFHLTGWFKVRIHI